MTTANPLQRALPPLIWGHGRPPRWGCRGLQGSGDAELTPVPPWTPEMLGRSSLCKASSAPCCPGAHLAIAPLPTPVMPLHSLPDAGSASPPQPGIPPLSPALRLPVDLGCPGPSPEPRPSASQRGYFGPGWRGAHPASPCPKPGRRHQLVVPRCPREAPGRSCRRCLGFWQGCGRGRMPAPAIWSSARGQRRCAWHRRTRRLSHRHQGPLPAAQGQIRAPQEGTRGRTGRASPASPACTMGRWLRCCRGRREPDEEEDRKTKREDVGP